MGRDRRFFCRDFVLLLHRGERNPYRIHIMITISFEFRISASFSVPAVEVHVALVSFRQNLQLTEEMTDTLALRNCQFNVCIGRHALSPISDNARALSDM